MKTILFTNARDETNILEWIVHHLNLGFTHIYIYDHLSRNPLQNQFIGLPVTVNRINRRFLNKTIVMKQSIQIATDQKNDYMIYLDCDEFLILNDDTNVGSFLNRYNNYDQIGVNWLLFGSNYHDNDPKGSIIENYTRSEGILNMHIKSFIKLPAKLKKVCNAHVYNLESMNKSIGTNYKLLNDKTPWFFENNDNYNDVSAYIAHYVYQSYETYLNRKVKLPRDDSTRYRDVLSKEEIHNSYNQNETLEPKLKYNEINKKKMIELNILFEKNEYFDWMKYVEKYQDLQIAGINTEQKAYLHWVKHGIREGRSCN